MKRGTKPLYVLCVVLTIVFVVLGWIWTTRKSITENASLAKKEFSSSLESAKIEFVETKQTKQIEKAAGAITNFLEEKEEASNSVIESLKKKIEANEYAKETTTE